MKYTILPKAPAPEKGYVSVTFSQEGERTELVRTASGTYELSVGVKELLPLTMRKYRTLVRRIVRAAKDGKRTRLVCTLQDLEALTLPTDRAELLRTFAENASMADYEFVAYKEKPKAGWPFLEEIVFVGEGSAVDKTALARGALIAKEVNACRDLANTPGGDMTPALLAECIQVSAKGTGAKVSVLTPKDLERLKMGALLGVGKGSKAAPRFIIVEYFGGKKGAAPIVLAGKGVTFDTGGLSLKGADHMLDMNLDMSGGAAVAHAVFAAARLKLKVNVVALIPAAENMPSGESYRPGDILRSMSGKTIEVLNTDAEGRVVLADALTYAKRYKPSLLIDVATLTGASLVALGTKASAVLSKDTALAQEICDVGEESGEYCWPLPMWDEYKDALKGRFGDVANIPTENSRYGGVINGGMFLAEFAEGRFAHIDMAPRMESDNSDALAQGAAGAPVRLLVRLLERHSS